MKRALAVCTVLAALAFSAFGIGTISGKWEAGLTLLPNVGLTKNVLTVNYTDFGMTFSWILSLLGGTSDTFRATVSGAFGPFTISGRMDFDFDAARYLYSKLTTGLDFAGLGIGLVVENWGPGNEGLQACPQTNETGNMRYTLTAKVDPMTAKIVFIDCSTGTEFYSLLVTVEDIGLCCGISLDAEFSFLKSGFDYLSLSGIEIPLCCGVSLIADVTFTTAGKTVTTGFDFAGFGDACFTVYADALTSGSSWTGIEVYGWKIKCSLGDCSYLEVLSALDPAAVEAILEEDIFQEDEFEYIKLGFCGAGCCGGQYTVDIAVYFNNGGGLFGISRLGAEVSIPVLPNYTVNVSFATPNSLSVGWVFTF